VSRWRSIPFPLPLSIHREPMPSPLFTLHQTMQVATTSFAQAGGPCFCLLCLPFDYRRRKRRRPLTRKQASKQNGTTAASNNMHEPHAPTREKRSCYSHPLPLLLCPDVSAFFGFYLFFLLFYHSSWLLLLPCFVSCLSF